MSNKQMYDAVVNNEVVYFDLEDVDSILSTSNDKFYDILFLDGDVWCNAKLKKTVVNRFNSIKKKRGKIKNGREDKIM